MALLHQSPVILKTRPTFSHINPSTIPLRWRSLLASSLTYKNKIRQVAQFSSWWLESYPHWRNIADQKTINQTCNHQVWTSDKFWKKLKCQIVAGNYCGRSFLNCLWKVLFCAFSYNKESHFGRDFIQLSRYILPYHHNDLKCAHAGSIG